MKVNPITAAVMGLLSVTVVISIIAFATPVWTQNERASFGLFRHCINNTCTYTHTGEIYELTNVS